MRDMIRRLLHWLASFFDSKHEKGTGAGNDEAPGVTAFRMQAQIDLLAKQMETLEGLIKTCHVAAEGATGIRKTTLEIRERNYRQQHQNGEEHLRLLSHFQEQSQVLDAAERSAALVKALTRGAEVISQNQVQLDEADRAMMLDGIATREVKNQMEELRRTREQLDEPSGLVRTPDSHQDRDSPAREQNSTATTSGNERDASSLNGGNEVTQ